MSFLDRLERRFGGIAIPGLTRIIASGMFLVFGLEFLRITGRETFLLIGEGVLDGQVWRLGSFLFVPAASGPIFFLCETMLLVLAGDALEEDWGAFRFTVYYLLGAGCTMVLAFAFPWYPMGSYFLNLSLFLAFATLFPDYEFLIFFVLPVKAKFLAMLSGAGIAWAVVTQPWPLKVAALVAIGNYLLFFGPGFLSGVGSRVSRASRQARVAGLSDTRTEARHRCTTCGRTEQSNPELEFRYCTCPRCGSEGRAFCAQDLEEHRSESST